MESKAEAKGWYEGSAKEEKGTDRVLMDDIHCLHWLEEVGMEQYHETFQTNFVSMGDFLSRKRLAQVQIRHFPSMNITNFDHQKILFKHITKVLEQEFVDQTKLAAEKLKREKAAEKRRQAEEKAEADKKSALAGRVVGVVKDADKKVSRRKQRFSFEDKAWEIINKSRGTEVKGAYDHLKDSDEVSLVLLLCLVVCVCLYLCVYARDICVSVSGLISHIYISICTTNSLPNIRFMWTSYPRLKSMEMRGSLVCADVLSRVGI
jgi:hypothetical protein